MPHGIPSDAILGQLHRIVAGRAFVQSERLCRFLRFVVEQALEGKEAKLKEYVIGVEVFDREEAFDPRIDSIVRVEARRLRAKLSQYYETEGGSDEILIQFRKGGYIPCFRRRARTGRHGTGYPAASRQWRAVVVLPFTCSEADAGDGAFAEGLAQEIISSVANTAGFRVVARTSAFRYTDQVADGCRVGEELDADAVVQGSIRREDGRVRVNAHIVDVWEGVYSWSESFDFEDTNGFAAQEEVSHAVIRALRGEPREGGEVEDQPRRPVPLLGYVRGRRALQSWTAGYVRRALQAFVQSLAEEPRDAASLAGLSEAWCRLALCSEVEPDEALRHAGAAAMRAIELDDGMPEGHMALGAVKGVLECDWEAAEREFQIALELDPMYWPTRVWLGMQKAVTGNLDGALIELRKARQADPLPVEAELFLGLFLDAGGDSEEAARLYRSALGFEPECWLAHWALGWNRLNAGLPLDAIDSFKTARRLTSELPMVMSGMGCALVSAGQPIMGRDIATRLSRAEGYVSPVDKALLAAALGNEAEARTHMEAAEANGDPRLALAAVLPEWKVLRERVPALNLSPRWFHAG